MGRVIGWCLALGFGVFTLFRVVQAWIRPHQATALFETTSITLVIVGATLATLAVRALARRRNR